MHGEKSSFLRDWAAKMNVYCLLNGKMKNLGVGKAEGWQVGVVKTKCCNSERSQEAERARVTT